MSSKVLKRRRSQGKILHSKLGRLTGKFRESQLTRAEKLELGISCSLSQLGPNKTSTGRALFKYFLLISEVIKRLLWNI